MELIDKDLRSIQEVRNLLKKAKMAQQTLAKMSQEEIDKIVYSIAKAGEIHAKRLGVLANEETGFGKAEDKEIKNLFASKVVYENIKNTKTVGIINEDKENKIIDIATPVGIVAALIPSTNPTSTVIYKVMISIKSQNAIVLSPHPGAKNSIEETVKVIKEAAISAGCPTDAIGCITTPTLQATDELMKNKDTSLILATGGEAMVRAAYSSGTPAIGVGPGNGPSFIDKTADEKMAVKRIIDSKTFDNGVICASEQSVIVEKCMENIVANELVNQGACILSEEEANKLSKFIMRANGTMNPQIVGKSVEHICNLAGLSNANKKAKVLVVRETNVGKKVPYSREKLAPILTFYVEENIDMVLEKSKEILLNEGAGHTFSMHTNDDEVVKRFGQEIPASRILVNTPSALGGIGGSTNLAPALTLGCGAIGKSSTTNNIGPIDLINIKRVAYGVREMEDLRPNNSYSTNNIDDMRFATATCEDNRFLNSDIRFTNVDDRFCQGTKIENPNSQTCDMRFNESMITSDNKEDITEEKVAMLLREVLSEFKN